MNVVFDASILLLLIDPSAKPPPHPGGQPPAKDAAKRIDHLLQRLDESDAVGIVPTPSLAELLIKAGAATSQYLEILEKLHRLQVAAFDRRAAVECAVLHGQTSRLGRGKRGGAPAAWGKVKFDHQIVAIAKVHDAQVIYSDDGDIASLGRRVDIKVVGFWDLPSPPEDRQGALPLDEKPRS
jgi:predicted nucleic acid-binding protein